MAVQSQITLKIIYVLLLNVVIIRIDYTIASISPDYLASTCENLIEKNVIKKERFTLPVNARFDVERSAQYWFNHAQATLNEHLYRKINENVARNVIFFLGDGMSLATITAARIYAGGESDSLAFEKFPYIGLAKTYCIDKQVPDSACTSTAYLRGVKANFKTIGVSGNVDFNDCKAAHQAANQVDSILSWAQNAGKATGIVTTTRITHASPAGAYAHTSNREFECDTDILRLQHNTTDCRDIAKQLILDAPGRYLDVVFGGGRRKFLPNKIYDEQEYAGERMDGLNLIDTWKRRNPDGKYIFDKQGLQNLEFSETGKVLGLFASDQMNFNLDADRVHEPSLEEMTRAAINILNKKETGFSLFIEGGRIDHAHHESLARKALDETVEFSRAIQSAITMTDSMETLVVVTSDHSHTMSISGYPARGADILGVNTESSDVDYLPYTILNYANGRGYWNILKRNSGRFDFKNAKIDKNFVYPGTFPTSSETHGGDDVAVFATGPMAHLFTGVYEQNVIPHLIGYAACIGPGKTACNSHMDST